MIYGERTWRIIGISGKAQSGKTTIANHLVVKYGAVEFSYAAELKEMCIKHFGLTREECYVKKTDKSRWILQTVGTNLIRNEVDEDFWVKRLAERIENCFDKLIVIPDVRFLNEAQYIKSCPDGELWRIERSDLPKIEKDGAESHPSETVLDNYNKWDRVIKSGGKGIPALLKYIDELMEGK